MIVIIKKVVDRRPEAGTFKCIHTQRYHTTTYSNVKASEVKDTKTPQKKTFILLLFNLKFFCFFSRLSFTTGCCGSPIQA